MILCLGTTPAVQRAMIFDGLALDAVNRAVEVIEAPAGKSINAARVLRALGRRPMALGFVGGDRGQFLRSALTAGGIEHDLVTVAQRTRMCVTVIDRRSGSHTELVEESGAVGAEACDELRVKLSQHLPDAQILALSGTLAPGVPPESYARFTAMAHDSGIPAIVDASGVPLREALAARPDLIKPNRAELAATLGRAIENERSLLEAMHEVVEMGARMVVVTLGGEGAAACDGRSAWRIRVPRVRVVNTIGSGDSFFAGLAAATADGRPLPSACVLGAACGVANAMTLLAGQVDADEVRRLEAQIEVEPMD